MLAALPSRTVSSTLFLPAFSDGVSDITLPVFLAEVVHASRCTQFNIIIMSIQFSLMSVSFPHIHSLPLVNRHSPAVSSTALCSGICGVFLKAETGVLMLGTKLEFTSVVLALAAAGEDTSSATFSSCSALKFGKGVFAVVVAMVAKGVFGGTCPVLAGICRESSGETATFTLSGAVNQIYIIKYYVTFIY